MTNNFDGWVFNSDSPVEPVEDNPVKSTFDGHFLDNVTYEPILSSLVGS